MWVLLVWLKPLGFAVEAPEKCLQSKSQAICHLILQHPEPTRWQQHAMVHGMHVSVQMGSNILLHAAFPATSRDK